MPKPETDAKTRRRTIHILPADKEVNDLDLWPYDEVWDTDNKLLGIVDEHGAFVTSLEGLD